MEKTKNGLTAGKALLMGTTLISLSAISATEVEAATGTGAMSAIILTPIVITNPTNLHWGTMTVAAGTGDTVRMTTTTSTRSSVGAGGVSFVTGAALESSGVMNIAGSSGQTVDITMTAGPFTVDDGVASSMTVSNFNLRTNAGGSTETIAIPGAGDVDVGVGADLLVAAGQTAGTYTGTFKITVNYQ